MNEEKVVEQETVDTQTETTEVEKVFTQEEVDKLIADRVKRAVDKAQKAAEKEFKAKADEAEKLRKMNAEQKAEYEAQKQADYIAELEAKINRSGLEKEASKTLNEKGLNVTDEVLEFVVKDTAEATQQAVTQFVELVEELAEQRVKSLLAGKTPKQVSQTSTTLDKASFQRLSASERMQLYQDNQTLYNELKGG